ncbi:MAG: hypothetical protein ABS55_03045 [Lautropia sp. SCN 70-15]|nr:MAG: hypothetical protein ABS55_03045 [Lautropia sp. SCN 70-15]
MPIKLAQPVAPAIAVAVVVQLGGYLGDELLLKFGPLDDQPQHRQHRRVDAVAPDAEPFAD